MMTEWFESITEQNTYYELTIDHGMRDEKGRTIGGKAIIQVSKFGIELRIFTLRDGSIFGAHPRCTAYSTLEAAKAAAPAKLAAQAKRYAVKVRS